MYRCTANKKDSYALKVYYRYTYSTLKHKLSYTNKVGQFSPKQFSNSTLTSLILRH